MFHYGLQTVIIFYFCLAIDCENWWRSFIIVIWVNITHLIPLYHVGQQKNNRNLYQQNEDLIEKSVITP